MAEVGEEFDVAIGAGDGRGDGGEPLLGEVLGDELLDFGEGFLVEGGVADDAAFADFVAGEFELGFDESDDGAGWVEDGKGGGKDFGEGNEGKIHHDEIDLFAEVIGGEVAGVEAFAGEDAGVAAEFPDELVGADVDGMNAGGAFLKEAIGKAAGRGSEVGADEAGDVELEIAEGAFEFESAASDVAGFFFEGEESVGGEFLAGLGDAFGAGEDFARHDEALGLFTGVAETAGDEEGVDALGGGHFLGREISV